VRREVVGERPGEPDRKCHIDGECYADAREPGPHLAMLSSTGAPWEHGIENTLDNAAAGIGSRFSTSLDPTKEDSR
jgi:hypothetical protein